MKSLNLILIFVCLISLVFADAENYEITYYGCPDECHTQRDPACESRDRHYQLEEDDFFAALSVDFDFKQYCSSYAVVMLTNGKSKMIKAQIVDSCGNCSKYHVDLSIAAFTALTRKEDGVANIIWGVFSSDGKHLAGPYENKASKAAENFKMSRDSFINAFIANGKKLAASSSSHRDFDPSISSSSSSPKTTTTKTTIKTTTTKTTTKTTVKTTTTKAAVTKAAVTKAITTTTNAVTTTTKITSNSAQEQIIPVEENNTITEVVETEVVEAEVPTTIPEPQSQIQPEENTIKEAFDEVETNNEEKPDYTAGIIALGVGSTLSAAGVGLLFLKKKNPSKYEDLKQKFPDAFTSVKRGISRRATRIKRSMSKKTPKQPTLPTNNEYVYTAPANLITF